MAKLIIEFMDGKTREYPGLGSDAYTQAREGIMMVMDVPYYGASGTPIASLPISNIREWKWER